MLQNFQNIDTALIKGKKLAKQGNIKLAIDLLKEVNKKFPKNFRVTNELSNLSKTYISEDETKHFNNLLKMFSAEVPPAS